MMMRDAHTAGRRARLKSVTILIAAAALLLVRTPVLAEMEQSPINTGGGLAGQTPAQSEPAAPGQPDTTEAPSPLQTESEAPLQQPAPAPLKPAPSGGTIVSPATDAYVAPPPDTALGAPAGRSASDESAPIVVSRSGGLPSLLFDNKAQNWLSATFGIGETYDSNVLLRSVKKDDFVTRIAPAVAFRFQNQLLNWNLGSSLDYRYYARNTKTGDLSYALTTNGRINLYRDYAYLIVTDRYSQISRSTAYDYTAQSSTVNVTDLNTLRVGPQLELPVTSRVRFNPHYTYTNYWYPNASTQNRQNHEVAADFSYEVSPAVITALGYSYVRMEGQLIQYDQQYPYLRVVVSGERLTLSGSVGYSRLDLDSGDTSDGMVWNASVSYLLGTTSFRLATSSDVDQSPYLDVTSTRRKVPQIVTSYSGGMTTEFRKARLSINLYFRENTDSQSSDLVSRRFGISGSLTHTLSPRLSGTATFRVERSDQRRIIDTYDIQSAGGGRFIITVIPVDRGGTQGLLYQLGYGLTYQFGNDWTVAGTYSYLNNGSPNTTNYTDNKVGLTVSKSF